MLFGGLSSRDVLDVYLVLWAIYFLFDPIVAAFAAAAAAFVLLGSK